MPQNKPRVIIPRNPEELLKLAQLIQEKDAELGNQSPLAFLDWKSKLNAINEAIAAQKEAEALRRQMESAYERRDALLQEITTWVRQSRDMLTGVYRQEMRKLGDFGFTVDSSPRSSRSEEDSENS
jgi:cell division protein ZapA (FtsZ GTPase activity inhibitor)